MKRVFCLLLCALLLTSCTAPEASDALVPALPEVKSAPKAPIGDAGLAQERTVALFLPSADGQRLICRYAPATVDAGVPAAEAAVRALLDFPGDEGTQPLAEEPLRLTGANPVEVSDGVCTVNLSPEARSLPRRTLFAAAQAITATAGQVEGIRYVNVLCGGYALSTDAQGYLPLGTLLPPSGEELPVLWELQEARRVPQGENPAQTPLTATATLYFPLPNGGGFVPETRRLDFAGQAPQQLVYGLLDALSAGAQTRANAVDMPDLTLLLLLAPEVEDISDLPGQKQVTLRFLPDARERLNQAGIDPACCFASLVYTLTGFVPEVSQVRLLLGDTPVTSQYSAAFGSQTFSGGIHTRADYADYLMAEAALYFADGEQLKLVRMPLPYRRAHSARALLLALAHPPRSQDAVLPETLTDADIIGLSVEDGVALVHLSAQYGEALAASPDRERLACYSMVSTLCACLGVSRARFFFGGAEADTLGGQLCWQGPFLLAPGMVRKGP